MINGSELRDAVISAGITIANRKQEVDELNVYPVPDGDTGTNMSMTIGNAAGELRLMDGSVTVSEVSSVTAAAMLCGARGNSGVILSLLFRGISRGLSGHEKAGCQELANSLELGVDAAYKAVMKPAEGTILTVARAAAAKAQETALSTNDTNILWREVCDEAERVLKRTPEMLPALKKAGVVEAGGMGLVIILRAMADVFGGGEIAKPIAAAESRADEDSFRSAVGEYDDDIRFTYCTEFMVQKCEACPDPFKLRAYLETIGDCIVVVDDEKIIKAHVHMDSPGLALQKALEFGCFVNDPKPKIENMRIQHENKVREAKAPDEAPPAAAVREYGFVAVGAGHGVEAMFRDLGADVVVRGGQTMNPSTEDILRAVNSFPVETVFVLPNDKNIIMAAEQAVHLTSPSRRVCVLQTRTIPQGISAMLAFDEFSGFADNRIAMTKAAETVATGLVTFAARDSEIDGHSIKEGEILALDNGRLAFTDRDITRAAFRLVRKMMKSSTTYVTLIYGADIAPHFLFDFQLVD